MRKGSSRIPALNRVENLADVSTRCSGLLNENYPFLFIIMIVNTSIYLLWKLSAEHHVS